MSSSLVDTTTQRLRDAGIAYSLGDGDTVRIAGRELAIGEIVVTFDDGEVSVFLGDFTHRHFTPYEADDRFPGCTPDQAAAEAVQFIQEVIEDKWLIWSRDDGMGGCYKPDGDADESADAPSAGEDVRIFRWSGSTDN